MPKRNCHSDEKVTNSQDDDFADVSTKNILNKLALMGLRPDYFQASLRDWAGMASHFRCLVSRRIGPWPDT